MKTENLWRLIRSHRGLGMDGMLDEVEAELAALEADNAAMREKTIEECARIAGESERAGAKWLEQWDRGIGSRMGPLDDDERIAFSHGDFICDQIRALTPDSGKVLVDEDMIRGIKDTIQNLRDIQNGCPLPKYQMSFDAINACADGVIEMLAELLKGRP